MIIILISWPPLASLTSNLTNPIFKGDLPHGLCTRNVRFDKNNNEVKVNSNVKLDKELEFTVKSVVKNVFFHYFDDFSMPYFGKETYFFHLRAKVNQF